jgi:hypothetical protein
MANVTKTGMIRAGTGVIPTTTRADSRAAIGCNKKIETDGVLPGGPDCVNPGAAAGELQGGISDPSLQRSVPFQS